MMWEFKTAARGLGVIAVATVCWASSGSAAEPSYTWVELPIAAQLDGQVYRINEHGQSVGTLVVDGSVSGRHAVMYDGDVLVDLALLPSEGLEGYIPTYAHAINNQGDVVGRADIPGGDPWAPRAFLYTAGKIVNIHPPGDFIGSLATGINDAGEIIGIAVTAAHGTPGFLYSNENYMIFPDSEWGHLNPWGINNSGVISGWHGYRGTFIWDHGTFLNLGISCTSANQYLDGAINESGQIAANGYCRPSVYTNGTFRDLGLDYAVAYGINDFADVVGHNLVTDAGWLYAGGALYYVDGLIANPVPGRRFVLGRDINNAGQIVGYGCDASGSCRGARLDPLVDTTPPLVESHVSGTVGSNGWYVSDVQLVWTVTDPESAISETTGCETTSVTADTVGVTFTCSASSQGGTTTESVTIKRDTTPPIATATAGPPPNAHGWNRTNVTVTFTGTDATSGVESCDPPVILKTNGTGQSASGRCYDFAGIQSDLATASGINIDKTKPTVVITSPTSGAVYSVGQVVLASYSCDDSLSGIVSCVGTVANGQPIYTSKESPVRSFKVTGKDAAGNSTSVTVKYAVQ